jgi:mannuronan 5-epimerase
MIRWIHGGIEGLLISISTLLLVPTGITGDLPNESSQNISDSPQRSRCIDYDSIQKLIEVRCKSVHLTDIYNSLRNPSILDLENAGNGFISGENHTNIWILNAGIVVDKESSLIIDSTDTSWLKITASPTIQLKHKSGNITNNEEADYSDDTATVIRTDIKADAPHINNIGKAGNGTIIVSKHNGDNPNGIHVHGSLKIDSVKITSWDPEKNDVIGFDFGKRPGEEHTKSDYDTAEPRAFIRVSKDATGTTNITNSEIAYLGYSCSRCAGLSYYGGEGSTIKNSNIHHLLKGFYSKNAGHITIDSNIFHDNYLYGIDPHTGSHHFAITNNLVYNNNASGIICSKDCYNLLIEGNEVYNNTGAARGIAFSINTTNSVAKNNYVHHQPRCISFNRASDHNTVYNNTLSNCKTGVFLSNTGNNSIYDNEISESQNAILLQNISNIIHNNTISHSINGIVFSVPYSNQTNDTTAVTGHIAAVEDYKSYFAEVVDANHLLDTKNPYVLKKQSMNSSVQVEQLKDNTTLR